MKIQVLILIVTLCVACAVQVQKKVVSEKLDKKKKQINEKKASIDSIESQLKLKLKKSLRFKKVSKTEHKKLASIEAILHKDEEHPEEKKEEEHHEEKKEEEHHEEKKEEEHKEEANEHKEEHKEESKAEHKEEEKPADEHHEEHKEEEHKEEKKEEHPEEKKEEEHKEEAHEHKEEHKEESRAEHKDEAPTAEKPATEEHHEEQKTPTEEHPEEKKEEHHEEPSEHKEEEKKEEHNDDPAKPTEDHHDSDSSTPTKPTEEHHEETKSSAEEHHEEHHEETKSSAEESHNSESNQRATSEISMPPQRPPQVPSQIPSNATESRTNQKKDVKSFLPKVHTTEDEIDITKLKMDLMTNNKFQKEFSSWEDSDYVKKISEYGHQELKAKRNGKGKEYNVIKNSFIKDKRLNEDPMIYQQAQDQQFTEVLTPVQQTPTQSQLWSNFKTSHFFDVDYAGRNQEQPNLEFQYDQQGNRKIFERVINSIPVKMTTKIHTDVDPTQGMLEDIANPLKAVYIDKTLNKDIKLNFNDQTYKGANLSQAWGMDKVMQDIDSEIEKHA